ncbi:uncharacterized protein PpBr36_10687 [Pyricularia pennisetigena]|uniref:uncharacterized protein n=1 Tax=Pyricularia pennisetigena TaxID=1578925 RepID=UPI001154CB04|nr:uncharacterized protein PpBr36_10687 [Pyricularia pennisetigena]TLS20833.1 hypothetical protein PpBr36_10687 [Pyricularia pennisetigena]
MVRQIFQLSLLVSIAAAIPAVIYRGDSRSPETIEADGGFRCRGDSFGEPKNSSMSYHQHVMMEPGNPGYNNDPWISTSSNYSWIVGYFGRHFEGNTTWIYHINTTDLPNAVDISEAYKADGKEYSKPDEAEIAVKDIIPWSNIIEWDKYHISEDGTRKDRID